MKRSTDWFCYDTAAETYRSVSVPLMFRGPAEDLIRLLEVRPDQRLLDAGAGTGAISLAARQAGLKSSVALDASFGMLKNARASNRVVARIPGFPFAASVFDIVTAGFLLTHLPDYHASLKDMLRVLKSEGKLGVTTWKVNQNEYTEVWNQVAQSIAGKDFFREPAREALPWEDLFTSEENLDWALKDSGFAAVEVHQKSYQCSTTIHDYLANRQVTLQARYLHQFLDEHTWLRFLNTVREAFYSRFEEPLQFSTSVLFGIARK